ncbi:MAG: cell division protein FtsL [Pseudomonadota bacterium]
MTADSAKSPWRLALLCALALGVCVLLGVEASRASQEMRSLHGELQSQRIQHDRLLAEHSRLLLERAALASHRSVDLLAEQQLGMRFPQTVGSLGDRRGLGGKGD